MAPFLRIWRPFFRIIIRSSDRTRPKLDASYPGNPSIDRHSSAMMISVTARVPFAVGQEAASEVQLATPLRQK
jgi:hypothetical protein